MIPLIREATLADIPAIISLAEEIWMPTYLPILGGAQVRYMLDTMYSQEALAAQMQSGQQFLLLMETAAMGFASYSKVDAETCKLNKLYVLPHLQGKGLGKALLGAVIKRVKDDGARELILNVNRYNAAKDFYERSGFVVSGEEDIDIGSGYSMNDYIMRMSLS